MSVFEMYDPRFRRLHIATARLDKLYSALGGGTGLFSGRPLSRLVRQSEQPHAAL
jgi:hypothetical protein